MQNFNLRGYVDVFPVVAALYKRQQLFGNGIPARHEDHEKSPVKSILLRGPKNPTKENWCDDLPCENYPALEAWPSAKALIAAVRRVSGLGNAKIGKVMISKLVPGGVFPWHVDSGEYHEHFIRFHVPLVTQPGALSYSQFEMIHMPVGSVWWFNNHVLHTSANWGADPRIHFIVDIRHEQKAKEEA